jgi:hypothetical protein
MKRKREVQACEEGYTFFEMVRKRQKRLERFGGGGGGYVEKERD